MYLGQWTPPLTFPAQDGADAPDLSDLTGAAADWIRCELGNRCGSAPTDYESRPTVQAGTLATTTATRTAPPAVKAGAGALGLLLAGGLALAIARGL